MLQLGNFLLKMDGWVDFGWKEAYWPFWIFFSILIGLSFSIFLIVATKLCTYCVYKKDRAELLSLLWLFYFVDGFTLMICLFVVYSQGYLVTGDTRLFLRVLTILQVYCFLGLLFSHLIRPNLIEFMNSLSSDNDLINGTATTHVNPQQNPLQALEAPEKKTVEKKNIEIPEFLFRYSSTFFKTATKKDILFKKLFSNSDTKVQKVPKRGQLKLKPGQSSLRDGMGAGKSVKKTDMSMVNFHLNVKDNKELAKHYRSMSYNRERVQDVLSRSTLGADEPQLKPEGHDSKNNSDQKDKKVDESIANLCGVCFANEPDSVFMRCGHGGVCYECAIDIWKSTGECYLCKEEIEQILQVEPQKNEKGEEYLKVIASTQLVDEDEVNEQSSKVEYIS